MTFGYIEFWLASKNNKTARFSVSLILRAVLQRETLQSTVYSLLRIIQRLINNGSNSLIFSSNNVPWFA